jgi:hypothetical protein
LLYSQPPSLPKKTRKSSSRSKATATTTTKRTTKPKGHHFHVQAVEFAELMCRGVAKTDLARRQQGLQEALDLDPDAFVEQRIQLFDVGLESGVQPNGVGVQSISRWLEEKLAQLTMSK